MAASAQDARVYNIPIDYFVQKLRAIQTSGLGLTYTSEAATPYGYQFHIYRGVSLTSWGENVTVTLSSQGNGTNVAIYSECSLPTQLIDWGKNSQNIYSIFMYLERDMASSAGANTQRSMFSADPMQASPGAQEGTKYCTYCGAQAKSDAHFCASCGKPFSE